MNGAIAKAGTNKNSPHEDDTRRNKTATRGRTNELKLGVATRGRKLELQSFFKGWYTVRLIPRLKKENVGAPHN